MFDSQVIWPELTWLDDQPPVAVRANPLGKESPTERFSAHCSRCKKKFVEKPEGVVGPFDIFWQVQPVHPQQCWNDNGSLRPLGEILHSNGVCWQCSSQS